MSTLGNGDFSKVVGNSPVVRVAHLPVMTATVAGIVPTPPNNTTTFLRGDGTFAAPPGGSSTPISMQDMNASFGGI